LLGVGVFGAFVAVVAASLHEEGYLFFRVYGLQLTKQAHLIGFEPMSVSQRFGERDLDALILERVFGQTVDKYLGVAGL